MPATRAHWTVDMVHALPDDGQSREVVDGELFVTPLVAGKRPRTWQDAGRPLLVVKVVSPTSARADRLTKRAGDDRVGRVLGSGTRRVRAGTEN